MFEERHERWYSDDSDHSYQDQRRDDVTSNPAVPG